jgi:hypothetical protein
MARSISAEAKMSDTAYEDRLNLYKQIEAQRQSRVIAYVTGDRPGMQAQISPDAVDLLSDHLDEIFPAKKISLVLYTIGGSTLAAWNMVTMLRMFCDELEIVIPSRARSAGTLMSLGADTIMMTKQATLGPIDPSLTGPLNPQVPGAAPDARAPVSVEAVRGYIEMAKQDFGVRAGQQMAQVLINLAEKVHPLVLGSIFRSRAQIQFLARELLKSQVKEPAKVKKIIEFLCSESGSHDYTINRREAKQLGLNVENPTESFYQVLKSLMQTIRDELELSTPFDQNAILGANQTIQYRCVRCLLESTATKGHVFVSEGELRRTQVNHPQLGPQEAIHDTRVFEGWKTRP